MDVDAPASPSSPSPSHPPLSSSSDADGDGASSRCLPFPGTVVDGARGGAPRHNLSKAGLRDLCDDFHLAKTGNKATLTDRLKKFSADRREWDGLLTGARNLHRGPQDAGVTKGGVAKPPKKKGTTKQSALRRELLFSDGAGSTSQPFLPTERSKDLGTKKEKAELLAWATEFVARKKRGGPPHPAPAPSSSQPYVSHDATAPVHGDACLGVLQWRPTLAHTGPERRPRRADPVITGRTRVTDGGRRSLLLLRHRHRHRPPPLPPPLASSLQISPYRHLRQARSRPCDSRHPGLAHVDFPLPFSIPTISVSDLVKTLSSPTHEFSSRHEGTAGSRSDAAKPRDAFVYRLQRGHLPSFVFDPGGLQRFA
ncbi:hypothetical protein EDB84DRAFT_1558965 [Lactarius hengduanensis]|nr:hypothetical protein EDB84DRAFT_1558965 [Lactarius hengduanensis]